MFLCRERLEWGRSGHAWTRREGDLSYCDRQTRSTGHGKGGGNFPTESLAYGGTGIALIAIVTRGQDSASQGSFEILRVLF